MNTDSVIEALPDVNQPEENETEMNKVEFDLDMLASIIAKKVEQSISEMKEEIKAELKSEFSSVESFQSVSEIKLSQPEVKEVEEIKRPEIFDGDLLNTSSKKLLNQSIEDKILSMAWDIYDEDSFDEVREFISPFYKRYSLRFIEVHFLNQKAYELALKIREQENRKADYE